MSRSVFAPFVTAAITSAVAVVVTAFALPGTAAQAIPPAANVVLGGEFESGGLGNWTCEDDRISAPGHLGTWSLDGVTSNNSAGRCVQTVAVQPNSRYLLTGWVRGRFVQLGATGIGAAPTVPSAATWTYLQQDITTGPSTDTVEVYVSGWYAQGRFGADDIALRGAPAALPGAPTQVTATAPASQAVTLAWTGSPRAAGYRVYDENGALRHDTHGPATSAAVAVGAASTSTLRVVAYNATGESAASAPVTATTPADAASVPPPTRSVVASAGPGASLWVAWEAVQAASAGYNVYVDGVFAGHPVGPALHVQGLATDRTYRVEVTAVNAVGESARSYPRFGTTLMAGAVPPPL
jgi:hypothetical protein